MSKVKMQKILKKVLNNRQATKTYSTHKTALRYNAEVQNVESQNVKKY
jgi:hypothetical protein